MRNNIDGLLPRSLVARTRWYLGVTFRLLGPLPLLLAALWLGGLLFLLIEQRPALALEMQRIEQINRELDVPLPMVSVVPSAQHESLSVTEYQQVKALFRILGQYQLVAQESRYQFNQAADGKPEGLGLDIPIQGSYRQFFKALNELTATLPITVNAISLSRTHPNQSELQIMLRVTLSGGEQ